MRALIQRVQYAKVEVAGEETGKISQGLLVFLGVEELDGLEDLRWLAGKICRLRIFRDHDKKMNLSLLDTGGDLLLVSQFTLHADTQKGNRPSFIKAAKAEVAEKLYHLCGQEIESLLEKSISWGRFGADMQVELLNDGPVTLWLDSKAKD